MTNNILVSIVIPVYNQEKLILRCLDSIPDRDDLEVICVNDGSTDNSLQVMESYNRIKNLRVFTQCNKGVGSATNFGCKHAIGKYICLIDNDDYVYTDNFNKVLDEYLTKDYDQVKVTHRQNNGYTWIPKVFRGAFTRRELEVSIKHSSKKVHQDTDYRKEFAAKYPDAKICDCPLVVYHWDYPKEGSLTDLFKRGLVDD